MVWYIYREVILYIDFYIDLVGGRLGIGGLEGGEGSQREEVSGK